VRTNGSSRLSSVPAAVSRSAIAAIGSPTSTHGMSIACSQCHGLPAGVW
jgi:hypothetical protein